MFYSSCFQNHTKAGDRMKKHSSIPKSILLFTPLPWRLQGANLSVALLLQTHPMSSQELRKLCEKSNSKFDLKELSRILTTLKKRGVITEENGRYICCHKALRKIGCPYNEGQILDLIGLTQSRVRDTMFYSNVPPMSVSSGSTPGSAG